MSEKITKSELERKFLYYWRILAPEGCAAPVQEYRFARPARQFRFDFCWVNSRVAVEIEGGVYSAGRHVRPKGYTSDVEKYNMATMLGWRVLRYTGAMLDADPARVVREVATLVLGVKAA